MLPFKEGVENMDALANRPVQILADAQNIYLLTQGAAWRTSSQSAKRDNRFDIDVGQLPDSNNPGADKLLTNYLVTLRLGEHRSEFRCGEAGLVRFFRHGEGRFYDPLLLDMSSCSTSSSSTPSMTATAG